MKWFLVVFLAYTTLICDIRCGSFNYEAMHNFGYKQRRNITNSKLAIALSGNSYGFPERLPPSSRSPADTMRMPYHAQYQGKKVKGDQRVYHKKFNYSAKMEGQLATLRGTLGCKITHLSAESSGIPIILQGGVGYYRFIVVVRAKPGDPLKGEVKAYCRKDDKDPYNL